MEYTFKKGCITLEKQLSNLDKFVFSFVRILDEQKVKYVLISGYIPILFGRSRETEDVDLFLEKVSLETFSKLWNTLANGFDCLNAFSAQEAYEHFLFKGLAIRFSEKNKFIPNIELKFPSTELNQFSLDNKIQAFVNGTRLYISNFELQIAFKLYLGTEKDVEDAIHVWTIFKAELDKARLKEFATLLKVENKLAELDVK